MRAFAALVAGEKIRRMGEGLSAEALWTLAHLARPLADGATESQAALEAGVTVHRAKRQLEELREELEVSFELVIDG